MFIDLKLFIPEIFLVFAACTVLLAGVFSSVKRSSWLYFLTQFSLLCTALLIYKGFGQYTAFDADTQGMFAHDRFGGVIKLLILLFTSVCLLYSKKYLMQQELYKAEYFALTLFSMLGLMLLSCSVNFITLYLSLELFALPIYAMITMSKKFTYSPEAAIKYFIMGAVASGMFLYGVSLLYGTTGSLDFLKIAARVAEVDTKFDSVHIVGMSLVLVAVAFKLGAAPFNMWLPDVYQGSNTASVLYISSVPKLAAFAMALRIVDDAFATLEHNWHQVFILLAVLSLIIGNVIAIAQSNIKRMLAYSTVSHVAFILLGLLADTQYHDGYLATFYYTLIYAIMAVTAFAVIISLSKEDKDLESLSDFKGLAQVKPLAATVMMVTMLSMAGIPPFAGFYAKFMVLDSLVQAGYIKLSVFALLMSVVGAFYYLRVIKCMYFDSGELSYYDGYNLSKAGLIVLVVSGALILLLGIYPSYVIDLCANSFQTYIS